jgi:uridine kinase
VPSWSFQSHRREGERDLSPADIIVVEGLHALHQAVALDVAVFVRASRAVRWSRWEYLETTGARGWGPDVARRFFDEVAEPTFDRYRDAYLARAHAVVLNDRGVPGVPTAP